MTDITPGQLRGRWLQQAILLIHDYDCARALDGLAGAEHKALLDHLAAHPDTPVQTTIINCKVGGSSAKRATP